MKAPVYLRDLKVEYQAGIIVRILKNPKLSKAFKAGEDITIGYYLKKPKVAE